MNYIVGLPRCRTTWFSALLTFGGYPCKHDALSIDGSPDKCKYYSDTKLHDYVNEHTVYIYRNPKDVMKSLFNAFEFPKEIEESHILPVLEQQYDEMKTREGVHVEFENLSDDNVIAGLWGHLTGSMPDKDYIRTMQGYSINVPYKNILEPLGGV